MALSSMIISVKGMSCNHCKASVEKALKTLEGVEKAEVDLQKAEVNVEFDPGVIAPEALQNAITAAGYEIVG